MNPPPAETSTPGGDATDQGTPRPAPSRKLLDDIFGDVLPTVTSDERDEQDGRGSGDAERDRWYQDNRPPHHG